MAPLILRKAYQGNILVIIPKYKKLEKENMSPNDV